MEKLNQYAPYVLIISGALVVIAGYLTNGNMTKNLIGLVFIGLGAFELYRRKPKN